MADDGADQVRAVHARGVANRQRHPLDRSDRPPQVHVDDAPLGQEPVGVVWAQRAHPGLDAGAVEVDVGVVGWLHALLADLAANEIEEGDDLAGAGQLVHDALRLGIVALLDLGPIQQVDLEGRVQEGEAVGFEAQAIAGGAPVGDAHGLGDQLEGRALMIVGVQHRSGAGRIGEADHRLDEGGGLGLRLAGQGHAHEGLEPGAENTPIKHVSRTASGAWRAFTNSKPAQAKPTRVWIEPAVRMAWKS